MSNVPPRRVVESYAAYDVINKADRSVRFRVIAGTEQKAYVEALDKIGFKVISRTISGVDDKYYVIDADDLDDVVDMVRAPNYQAALLAAIKAVGWEIDEPEMMVGGIVGGQGFSGTDD